MDRDTVPVHYCKLVRTLTVASQLENNSGKSTNTVKVSTKFFLRPKKVYQRIVYKQRACTEQMLV